MILWCIGAWAVEPPPETDPPVEANPTPAPAPRPVVTTSVVGTIRSAGTREVLSGVIVGLRSGAGRDPRQTTTDEAGQFRFEDVPVGPWTLTPVSAGYRADDVPLTLLGGRQPNVTMFWVDNEPWRSDADAEIVVVGQRVTPEITERVIPTEIARTLPGTNGDVVRVIQNLPGVARPPLNIGQLLVRGTAPEDSAYYLDGAPIPLVFHFSGFSTVLNGDALEEIAYLPGNYGVRYGRTLGGVIDLRIDDQLPQRSGGYVSVDLFQTTGFVEQRIGRRHALTVSGRRSYIDAVLNPVLNSGEGPSVQAPRYADFQLRWLTRRKSGGTVDALLLFSDDRFRVVGDGEDNDDVQIGFSTTFGKARLLLRDELGRGWRNELSVIAGRERQAFAVPDGVAFEDPISVAIRDEVFIAAAPVGLRAGIDSQIGQFRFAYEIPTFGEPEGADISRIAPAAYIEPTFQAGPVRLVPGLRVDGLMLGNVYRDWTFDPRFSSEVRFANTTLKGSTGLYSQWPTVRQAIERPELTAARGWQSAVGLEQQLSQALSVEVTGYTQLLSRLVSGREDAFRFFTGPPSSGPFDTDPYANDGTGQIFGLETLLRFTNERTTAWFSGTFGRSTRVNRPGGTRELFEYDQPIILTALASHQLSRGWRLGARARYSSGNPFTPVVNRFFDLASRQFVPVYGPVDSARLPAFWQLDVRVDKEWTFDRWALSFYLDLQNATNAQNVEVIGYTFDFTEENNVTQIPIVPAFGLRGSW
ncbi:MAG: TonB-dependent receptor [Myxococcota bacterium]